jgi:hypothetical protein
MAKSRREDERLNSELKRRHGLAIDEMDDNDRRWVNKLGRLTPANAQSMRHY